MSGRKRESLSPTTARELQALMESSGYSSNTSDKDDVGTLEKSLKGEGLEGEDLVEFKRKRNAFHSRKKRLRKKEFVERLNLCFERVSAENRRLKTDHAFLRSKVSQALQIVDRVEASRSHDDTYNFALRPHIMAAPGPLLPQPVLPWPQPSVLPHLSQVYRVPADPLVEASQHYPHSSLSAAILLQVSEAGLRPSLDDQLLGVNPELYLRMGSGLSQAETGMFADRERALRTPFLTLQDIALARRQRLFVEGERARLMQEERQRQNMNMLAAALQPGNTLSPNRIRESQYFASEPGEEKSGSENSRTP